ncbi:MAG: sulfatase [Planctomycetota bacterium]
MTTRPRSLTALGLRCGMALALLEIGSAFNGRFSDLDGLLRPALFFLFPLAVYGILGQLIGGLAARLFPEGRAGSRGWILPVGIFFLLGILDLFGNRSEVGNAPLLPVLGLLAGLALVAAPPFARPVFQLPALRWGNGLVLAGVAATLAWLLGAPGPVRWERKDAPAGTGRPNLVLVTWDTVRADVLPLYRGTGIDTPHLEAFAKRSVVFENMFAVAPLTAPSHASMLTGVVPLSHGIRTNLTSRLASGVTTLPEVLSRSGYDTAAFVAAPPLEGTYGFDRGFRVYDDRLANTRVRDLLKLGPSRFSLVRWMVNLFRGGSGLVRTQLPAPVVLERVGDWLEDARGPFFLWVHFYDCHVPYEPREPFRSLALRTASSARPAPLDLEKCGETMPLYRGEVLELDDALGRLLQDLEGTDPGLANTAVFLIADHGECFGEHGHTNKHAISRSEATLHIPAVLHLPGGQGGGRRVADFVDQVDVAPTLAALAGPVLPGEPQGVSLLPAARGTGPLPARTFFREGFDVEAWNDSLLLKREDGSVFDLRKSGIRTPGEMFWMRADPESDGAVRLYDLARDPAERNDLSGAGGDRLTRAKALLGRIRSPLPQAEDTSFLPPRESLHTLKELGYLDGPEDP